jgi:phenylpropionate dioxygenase-like ring-hydroxylating dioxygenase large terminal subunit
MTNAVESVELTRVGPGTPMGALMRNYWLPALRSDEVVTGREPVRLMLLGEKLIAFRDAKGEVGVMDHRCPHRCASLFYGRNEGDGLVCVYHGWKFAADGKCLDQPNLPASQQFRDKVHAKAYKVHEQAGLIWVYMGEREQAPPMPAIEAALLPEAELNINFTQRECNWLQALEGDIDTSHFSWLHVGSVQPDDVQDDNWVKYQVVDRAPDYEVTDTDWGTMYCATRPVENGQTYWRFAHFAFPFWTFIPQGTFVDRVIARAWVPMDDTHVMFVGLSWKQATGTKPLANGKPIPGSTLRPEYLPNTTDWLGRFRPVQRAANDYQIDREAQRNNTIYTGIVHIAMQDQAITESMGEIVDHSFEHLAPSDQMITRTRRRLLLAARALRDHGTAPPTVDDPGLFQKIRSGERILKTEDWKEAYEDGMTAAVHPVPMAKAAE